MSLDEFRGLVNPGDITFFINKHNEITCDQRHHVMLFRDFVRKNWTRFTSCMSTRQLFATIVDIPSNCFLRFSPKDGLLIDPPPSIATLLAIERRNKFTSEIIQRQPNYKIMILSISLIIALVFSSSTIHDLRWAFDQIVSYRE